MSIEVTGVGRASGSGHVGDLIRVLAAVEPQGTQRSYHRAWIRGDRSMKKMLMLGLMLVAARQ